MLFMNDGYADLHPETKLLVLASNDEPNRYAIQLYQRVAGAVELEGLDVVEVGCGRGGGSAYIAKYLKPKSVVGVDITAGAIDFCRRQYTLDNLSFLRGDAQALDFNDESYDVVVNIESSICYEDVDAFFAEVVRILRPNGYFLYADFRQANEMDIWRSQIDKMGLQLVAEEEITSNVLRSLDLDNERKEKLIGRYVPWFLRQPFNEFAGMKGTEFFYGAFANGEKIYKRYVFMNKVS
jgi:ubiquinone/menaquinone biosynthesis C-methylase UbiE